MAYDQRLYIAALIAVVVLLIIYRMWRDHSEKSYFASNHPGRVPDNPGNPQPYEYNQYLRARAALAAHKSGEHMMNTHHWDQKGTYQHTADTWGLPTGYSGDSRTNYSGFSKENMSVGAHWDTDGTYGHTASTLPAFGLSGYYEDTPTDSFS